MSFPSVAIPLVPKKLRGSEGLGPDDLPCWDGRMRWLRLRIACGRAQSSCAEISRTTQTSQKTWQRLQQSVLSFRCSDSLPDDVGSWTVFRVTCCLIPMVPQVLLSKCLNELESIREMPCVVSLVSAEEQKEVETKETIQREKVQLPGVAF